MNMQINLRIVSMGIAIALALYARTASADDEASNVPTVTASRFGNCYTKSIPAALYGESGVTKVYVVRKDEDQLVHTFNWFAKQVFIECNVAPRDKATAVAVARIGPGIEETARAGDLAFAFYWNGGLVKQYSTLDVSGDPINVSVSVSHYTVLRAIDGFRWRTGNQYAFEAIASDGKILRYDASTGEKLPDAK